jgi:hypothetical protein
MAGQTWFVVRGGTEEGPCSGTQLKDMAASGKLQPTDLVRRGDVETARPAGQIKGLFPATSSAVLPDDPKQPAGLPQPATNKKKWLVIGSVVAAVLFVSCAGLFTLGLVVTNSERKAAQKDYAEADALWTAGKKDEAAAKYRSALKGLRGEERALAYGRLIDHECEKGNTEAARTLAADAAKAKVTPTVSHPDAKTVVASAHSEARADVPMKEQGKSGKGEGVPKAKPSETELIQLLAKTAVAAASKRDSGKNVDPDAFNDLMRLAAKELGAGNDDSTKHLLLIEPASRKEVPVNGRPGLVVRYGDGLSRTWAGFVKSPSTGRWQLFMAQFGDEEWNAVTGLGKAKP